MLARRRPAASLGAARRLFSLWPLAMAAPEDRDLDGRNQHRLVVAAVEVAVAWNHHSASA